MQRNSAALVDKAIATKEPIYLTRHGRSAVVLLDADEFDRRMKFQDDFFKHEMKTYNGIKHGHGEITRGEYTTLEETLSVIDQRLM
ncbi:MAG: type II toxin-antitoxin system Phd/YefM family antitoxin [Coriobacteriales bacterium]|nr:type II toxin-antitoxin system Phd/YefM family antitoxin [Coriobacteriales bacterium]